MPSFFSKLIELDEKSSYALRVAEKPGIARNAAMFFAHSGDSWFWGAGLLLLWFFGPGIWKRWAFYEFVFIAALAVVIIILKFSIKRKRPEGEWGKIYRNTDPHSFPSGHAARAFLIATLAVILGPSWIAAILLIWAPLVTLSRVLMGVHYLSDVIAGAIVGILFAYIGWSYAINFPLPMILMRGF